MTTNKHFNSYKEGLDVEFLREYCMEHGERRVMERDKMLERGLERLACSIHSPLAICCPI